MLWVDSSLILNDDVDVFERIAGHTPLVWVGTVLCIERFEESTIKDWQRIHSYISTSNSCN